MLGSMCQPLSERKRPALADLGAGFNRPCWGLEGTSAARDRLAATARTIKWEFAAGAGWRDGKWNYLPSSDKWMSLWEIEWILQPSLAQVQMWLMANSSFFFLLLSLVFKSVKRVERSQEKKKKKITMFLPRHVFRTAPGFFKWSVVVEGNLFRNCVCCLTEEETINAAFFVNTRLSPSKILQIRLDVLMWDLSVVCSNEIGVGSQSSPLSG